MEYFDDIDKNIIKSLQLNSRITIKELAANLHLSTTPIFERIKRLEKRGVIEKYVALMNPKKLGKSLHVFLQIAIKEHSNQAVEKFVNDIQGFDEIMECHHISGDSDFMLKILVADIDAYQEFIMHKLSNVPNVGRVKSNFSLSVSKQTHVISIAAN